MAEGRQFRGGAHGSRYKPRFFRGAVAIGHLPGQACGFDVEVVGLVLKVVFGQHQ